MSEAEKRTPEALGQAAAAAMSPHTDKQIDSRQVMQHQMQDAVLKLIRDSGLADPAAGTCDAVLIVECLAATMIPFAVMGEMNEDQFCDQMRMFFRQVATSMQLGGQTPQRIIVPGRG